MTNIWTGHKYQFTIIKYDLERLSVTLTFERGTWVLPMTLSLTFLPIYFKINSFMKNIFNEHDYQCPMLNFDLERLSVTLTFELETWVLRATHCHSLLYICAKLSQNPSTNDKDMDRT